MPNTRKTTTGLTWSEDQLRIYEWVEKYPEKNLIIQSCAGSSKTTVLVELVRREVSKTCPLLYLAFNTDIVKETSSLFQKDSVIGPALQLGKVHCRGFHSLGLSLITKFLGSPPIINHNKIRDLSKRFFPPRTFKKERGVYPFSVAARCVRHIRQQGVLTDDEEEIREFLLEHDRVWSLNPEVAERERQWMDAFFSRILTVLHTSDETMNMVDFADMVRLPCMKFLVPYGILFKGLFVDELQDLNPYQHHLLRQYEGSGARIIGAGDSFQSIYGFLGSVKNSMDLLQDHLHAEMLQLSISYRVPQVIVKYVNKRIPNSTMVGWKTGGTQLDISKKDISQLVKHHNVTLIIGAKNKSLIEVWIHLLKNKIGSTLKGTPITEELRKLIEDFPSSTFTDLLRQLRNLQESAYYKDPEIGEVICLLSQKVMELLSCFFYLIEELHITTFDELNHFFSLMEHDQERYLHTCHSVKGLQAPAVIVLGDWFDSSQRVNMQYVAWTRAQNTLLCVTDWNKKEENDDDEEYEYEV